MTEAIFDLLHEPRDTRKRYTFRYSMTISGVVEIFAEDEKAAESVLHEREKSGTLPLDLYSIDNRIISGTEQLVNCSEI